MSAANIDDLFLKTLVGDYDSDEPWDAVRELRRIASREVFDVATGWCRSEDPLRRARGADVLAQLGKTLADQHSIYAEASYEAVSDLLECETDLRPLTSAISALGHIGDPRAISLVVQFAPHPDAEVRFAVAFALGNFPNDERSAEALMVLSQDGDDDVRDWAIFGLGTLGDLDSPEIREVFVKRLADSFADVRQEAMAALSKRRDPRVLPALLRVMEQPLASDCEIEAAYLMLGFEGKREDWEQEDYANALREKFGLEKG